MKSNLKQEIINSYQKLINLKHHVGEINQKIERLGGELQKAKAALEKEAKRVQLLGMKQPSTDATHPDTQVDIQKKEALNRDLNKRKLEILKENFPEHYQELQDVLPSFMRD